VNYIHLETTGIIIISNAIVSQSNLLVIERYIKNIDNITSDKIQIPRLSQSKSYLKITGISYYADSTNLLIISDDIEAIIKSNHIFNDLMLASKPRIIKVSHKSNMVVI